MDIISNYISFQSSRLLIQTMINIPLTCLHNRVFTISITLKNCVTLKIFIHVYVYSCGKYGF